MKMVGHYASDSSFYWLHYKRHCACGLQLAYQDHLFAGVPRRQMLSRVWRQHVLYFVRVFSQGRFQEQTQQPGGMR